MDRTLFSSSWQDVIDRDGYVFTHTRNAAIYLLPYRRPYEGAYLLGRFEVCPAHGSQQQLYAITGQCPPDADPLAIAVGELFEEAGISAAPSQLIPLGAAYLTKQADTIAHFFAVDVTDLAQGVAPTDGSAFEQGSLCVWVSRALALSAPCVGLQALIARSGL